PERAASYLRVVINLVGEIEDGVVANEILLPVNVAETYALRGRYRNGVRSSRAPGACSPPSPGRGRSPRDPGGGFVRRGDRDGRESRLRVTKPSHGAA